MTFGTDALFAGSSQAANVTAQKRAKNARLEPVTLLDIDTNTLYANPPDREFRVIEADSIGGIARQSTMGSRSYGYGKSQTITNLIDPFPSLMRL